MVAETCYSCKKSVDDQPMTMNFSCGCEKAFHLDCLPNSTTGKCSDCSSVDACKCFKCEKNIDSSKKGSYQRIEFKTCKAEKHFIDICVECIGKNYEVLVSKEDHMCFLCHAQLKENKYLYYTEKLKCKDGHEINLCGSCKDIFTKVDVKCPVCTPPKIGEKHCLFCYGPCEIDMYVMPIQCNNKNHQFRVCLDCISCLNQPRFACRLCQNKKEKNYAILKTIENDENKIGLIGIKLALNEINKNSIEYDHFICPTCEPISIKPGFIECQSLEEEIPVWMDIQASVANCGNYFILSGGYNLEFNTSVKTSLMIKFNKDGRFRNYTAEYIGCMMNKGRHSHGSYFSEKDNSVYIFGGCNKQSKDEVEYLDTIEIMILGDTTNMALADNFREWQKINFKLKKARASFSFVEVSGLVYIFGGFEGVGKVAKSVEIVDFIKSKSKLVDLKSSDFSIPINPVLKKDGSKIILYGGYNGQRKNDQVFEFDVETEKVRKLGELCVTVSGKQRKMEIDNQMLVFGGNLFGKTGLSQDNHFRYMNIKDGKVDEQVTVEEMVNGFNKNSHFDVLLDQFEGVEFEFKA